MTSIKAFRLAGPQIYRSVEERSVGRRKMTRGRFGWLALEDSKYYILISLYLYMYTIYIYILIYFIHVGAQLLYSNHRESYRKATWIGQLVWTVTIYSFTNLQYDWNIAALVARWHVMIVNFTECQIQALKFDPAQHAVTYRFVWWNVMQTYAKRIWSKTLTHVEAHLTMSFTSPGPTKSFVATRPNWKHMRRPEKSLPSWRLRSWGSQLFCG